MRPIIRGERIIYIVASTPVQALDEINNLLLANEVKPEDYKYAELSNNVPEEFCEDDPDCYPLKFKSRDRRDHLWVSGISAGNHSPESIATFQALLLMDFQVNPREDVYSLAKGNTKIFEKNK